MPPAPKTILFTLPELDGRTRAAKMVSAISNEVANDLGGNSALSEVQRQLIRRFSCMCVMARQMEDLAATGEEPMDVTRFTTLVNAMNRLAVGIGLKRVPRDVTSLDAYLSRLPEAGGTE